MLVYRAIEDVYRYRINDTRENEYREYLKGIICTPAKEYNHGLNTHDYKRRKSYIHFFNFYEDAVEYISNIPGALLDSYVAKYNIPEELLKKYIGFGYYPEHIEKIPVMEYAIPYEELNNKFITFSATKYHYDMNYTEDYKNYLDNYQNIIEETGIDCWWTDFSKKKVKN